MLADLDIFPKYDHGATKFSKRANPSEVVQDEQILSDGQIVFLHRDPRDVVVSAYYYFKLNKSAHDLKLSDFIRNERIGFEKIVAFNAHCLRRLEGRADAICISYEDLYSQPEEVLRKCIDFLGLPFIRPREIREAVARRAFAAMQKQEQDGTLQREFGETLFPSTQNADETNALKVRSGKIGSFISELDEGDLSFCNDIMDRYQLCIRLKNSARNPRR